MRNITAIVLVLVSMLVQMNLFAEINVTNKRKGPAGLYALWYQNKENPDLYLNQPYITGGQMVFQWKNLEPEKGVFDFSEIAKELKMYGDLEIYTTIQINGNLKPDWLYEEVPYHPEKFSVQVRDKAGSLMFWHPTYKKAYVDMLSAFADFIKNNEYGQFLLGIRQNFNGFGTEHMHIPHENIDLDQWIIPAKTNNSHDLQAWSLEVMKDYQEFVLDNYIDLFSETMNVFVRNTIPVELEAKYKKEFESGDLCWFHTSTEVEPRNGAGEIKYKRFYDDCRSGKTVAYAEPWASAWGHHGGKTDDRWCSPPQWFYWTQLFDLHCGVSYIGIYSNDMNVAIDGTYNVGGVEYKDGEDKAYQREFIDILNFSNKYVGYHNNPSKSPGAWVAFRENNMVLAANGMSEEERKLNFFTGDYNFLMERVSDNSFGQNVITIGPDDQRFGAWARVLPAGGKMELKLDDQFLKSCIGQKVLIKVIYYDAEGKDFDLVVNEEAHSIKCQGSDSWMTGVIEIKDGILKSNNQNADISIRNGAEDIYLHMVEVVHQIHSLL